MEFPGRFNLEHRDGIPALGKKRIFTESVLYDLLIVGAGITAATLAARLKSRLKLCVIDCRSHLGGNCFDETSEGTLIHKYGPHIFHSPSQRIVSFLDHFTKWNPYVHTVTAEIDDNGSLRPVPFPYSRQTSQCLGRDLSEKEIIDSFFRGYSRKMWGMDWESLPASVRKRIPKKVVERPLYYRDNFVALPHLGYTHMMENMFDGIEIHLGVPPNEWVGVPARMVVYTGRPDLIPIPGEAISIGEHANLRLNFRTLDISFSPEDWQHDSVSFHACSPIRPWTRKTYFARMTGGTSPLVSTEVPRQATHDDPTPFYPIESAANLNKYGDLQRMLRHYYPNLVLAGRLGSYRYFDMYQAVGHALSLAHRLLGEFGHKM